MFIDFNAIEAVNTPHFKGGEGSIAIKSFNDNLNKIMNLVIEPGMSIGEHTHETNSEIVFVASGKATVVIENEQEIIPAGSCHYCPKGSTHTLMNKENEPLVLFAVVTEQ